MNLTQGSNADVLSAERVDVTILAVAGPYPYGGPGRRGQTGHIELIVGAVAGRDHPPWKDRVRVR